MNARHGLAAGSRLALEGAYLPWTREERRASTSKGRHEIWINHIRDHVVLDAVDKVQTRIEELREAKKDRQQLELHFGDVFIVESPSGGSFSPSSCLKPPFSHQSIGSSVVSC